MTDISAQVGNWTEERCNTQGTGDLIVSGTVSAQFVMLRDSLNAGLVWYSIQNGYNSESGIGVFDGVDTIQRTQIGATFEGGVYSASSPLPINLIGPSIVSCTLNAAAFNYFSGKEDALGNPPADGYNLTSTTGGVRSWTDAGVTTGMQIRVATTATTLQLTDQDNYIEINDTSGSTGNVVLSIPDNATVPFPIGSQMILQQTGPRQVLIGNFAGVTVQSESGLLFLKGQYSMITIFKKDTNIWTIAGDLI